MKEVASLFWGESYWPCVCEAEGNVGRRVREGLSQLYTDGVRMSEILMFYFIVGSPLCQKPRIPCLLFNSKSEALSNLLVPRKKTKIKTLKYKHTNKQTFFFKKS